MESGRLARACEVSKGHKVFALAEARAKSDASQVGPQASPATALDSRPFLSLHCALRGRLLSPMAGGNPNACSPQGPSPCRVCPWSQGSPARSLGIKRRKVMTPTVDLGQPQ